MPSAGYLQAWEALLDRVDASCPVNRITAAQIKQLGKEPRLMTKYDSSACRHQPLKDRGLFLLPATNSSYHLLAEDGYCDLDYSRAARPVPVVARFPFPLETLESAASEMSHLDRLFLAGAIGRFTGTDRLYATIRGRRFSPAFTYRVGGLGPLESSGIQYEVDQGYESLDEIILFEAKTTTPSDFLIRQLYFPFRVFSGQCRKRVRCVFLNYRAETGVYSFFEYGFADPQQYKSIELVREGHYRLEGAPRESARTLGEFMEEAGREHLPNTGWELPQANDFGKVMDFPLRVAEGFNDSSTMAMAFDFDPRQSSYYRRACEQMGLVSQDRGRQYVLTERGNEYLALSPAQRTDTMIRAMLSAPIFRAAVETALGRPDNKITCEDVVLLAAFNSPISGSTIRRRAQSVRAWFRWLRQALGELRVQDAVLDVD